MDLMERLRRESEAFNSMTGDPHANGGLFKGYTQRLFKPSDFGLLHDTTKIESETNPDFQFWHKRSGHSFCVDCKFRTDYDDDDLNWFRPDQIKCYKQFLEKIWPEKVFVVIGFGGRPLKPSIMFCMPLDDIESLNTFPKVLEKYERLPTRPFDYQDGRLV